MKQWQKFKTLLSKHKLLSGLGTAVIVFILTLIFNPPTSEKEGSQVAEGGNITNVTGGNNVQIHQEITNNYNFTEEQVYEIRKKRIDQVLLEKENTVKELQEINTKLQSGAIKDNLLITLLKEKATRLEKENYRINNELKELKNTTAATYKQTIQLKQEIEKNLLTLQSKQPKAEIAQVLKELRNNPDTRKTEKDLDEIVESGAKEIAPAAYESGRLAENRVDYRKAMKAFTKAVILDENNPDYLLKAAQMATKVGDFDQAKQWFEKLIELTQHDTNSLDYANAQGGLAGVFYEQGKYDKAEPLYNRALVIREKALGENHPDVATTLNNLAALYYAQGEYAKAEPLYNRVLVIREKALGENHPDVATTLNNLALLYKAQGEYAKAEPLYKRSLAIKEKALGENHPSVATTLNNLALLYKKQGEYAKAEPLYKKALNILHKIFPKGHPDIDIIESNYEMLKNKK
ncbi:tetratricopeptide repeat protein [Pasteurella atlantica]|nr:tetratricopeptide repeat protein [Pasteurella atlantica]MDP8034140.1 tetratricopeptide repeat protein [Pasteurella atlantica]MDP8064210.1 tetratricopeptide repeat protein [Pasteurella atlantica]MDP8068126.1 tetratricopeptide repeat protein [Pasteurella atlantica]MDP8073996.1 tetratricopeptide repeat protein [Pasteurella atlantica]MDP8075889.1 tetratricopeptide repeat protein [Pasteurella atlantica]